MKKDAIRQLVEELVSDDASSLGLRNVDYILPTHYSENSKLKNLGITELKIDDFKSGKLLIGTSSELKERALNDINSKNKYIIYDLNGIPEQLKGRIIGKKELDKAIENKPNIYKYVMQAYNVVEHKKADFYTKEFADEKNKNNIRQFKEDCFKDRSKPSFALILGNGVSIPYGAKTWDGLVKELTLKIKTSCLKKYSDVINYFSSSLYSNAEFSIDLINDYFEKDGFKETMWNCLYNEFGDHLFERKQPTLVSIVAKAKTKYPNIPVLTYNYDTFVEKYYGYLQDKKTKNKKYISYYSGADFANNYAQNVIHLHGYVSYTEKNMSDEIILSTKSYFDSYLSSKQNHWVIEAQKDVLRHKTVLYVGSSMTDLFQMSIINEIYQENPDNFRCYALLNLGGLDPNDQVQIMNYYYKKGIIVIFGESFGDLPILLGEVLF